MKEFYGYLFIKGTTEQIDEWILNDAQSFACQYYLEECDEQPASEVYTSEEVKGMVPYFTENYTNEDNLVVRIYSLGSYYWTDDDYPLDLDTIEEIAPLSNDLAYCFISVEKEDWDENEDEATTITRTSM